MSEATQTAGGEVGNPNNVPPQNLNGVGNATTNQSNATSTQQTPPESTATKTWVEEIGNEDLRGYIQNKGFKSPEAVAESYRNLEKLNGAPEKLLKLPEGEGKPEEWAPIYTKLGKPEKAEHYQLPVPEGQGAEFKQFAEGLFHENNLTVAQGRAIAEKWNNYVAEQQNLHKAQLEEKMVASDAALKKEWGAAYEKNFAVAKGAAQALGMTKEVMEKLEASMGIAEVNKLFHTIGTKIGEDSYVSGDGQGGFGVMTPVQAKQKIDQLKSDADWATRFAAGGAKERAEWDRLHQYMVPSQD